MSTTPPFINVISAEERAAVRLMLDHPHSADALLVAQTREDLRLLAIDIKEGGPAARQQLDQEIAQDEAKTYFWYHGAHHAALVAPGGKTLLQVPQGKSAQKLNWLPSPPSAEQLATVAALLDQRDHLLAALKILISADIDITSAREHAEADAKSAALHYPAYTTALLAITKAEGGAA